MPHHFQSKRAVTVVLSEVITCPALWSSIERVVPSQIMTFEFFLLIGDGGFAGLLPARDR